MPISISNRQNKVCLTQELEKIINEVLNTGIEKEKIDPHLEVSVALVDNEAIRDLNREYRNQDKPTDVLSFAYREDNPEEPDYEDPMEEEILRRYYHFLGEGQAPGGRIWPFIGEGIRLFGGPWVLSFAGI